MEHWSKLLADRIMIIGIEVNANRIDHFAFLSVYQPIQILNTSELLLLCRSSYVVNRANPRAISVNTLADVRNYF